MGRRSVLLRIQSSFAATLCRLGTLSAESQSDPLPAPVPSLGSVKPWCSAGSATFPSHWTLFLFIPRTRMNGLSFAGPKVVQDPFEEQYSSKLGRLLRAVIICRQLSPCPVGWERWLAFE